MHERSLVRSLLRQINRIAADHSGSRPVSVRVRIGEFCGVEPELLSSAFADLVRDTPLQDVVLQLERVPLEASCDQCGNRNVIDGFRFRCAKCGSMDLTICGGEEMLLDSVAMEEFVP